MTILITGGSGFIGSKLVTFLKNQGQEVIVFQGDITEPDSFNRYQGSRVEAVIHLAGKTSGRPTSDFFRINSQGANNVTEFCHRQEVGRLIFFSSIKVLSKLNNPYIVSKRKAEEIIAGSGVPYVIIRPSLVYGPGDSKNIGRLINLAGKLPVLPVSNIKFQPVYLDDLLEAVLGCLKIAPNRVVNLAGLETIAVVDILRILKGQGFKARPLVLPKIFNRLIWLLALLPFSPLPAWQVKSLLDSEEFTGDDWPIIFNIKPTFFKEGLIKTLNQI